MSKEEFVKVMGYAGVIYHKEFAPLEINAWYEFFKDVPFEIGKAAIKNCAMKMKFMPAISELLQECTLADMEMRNKIIEKMYMDGYFRRGLSEKNIDNENRNYMLAQCCIVQEIIPTWLLEDMIEYGYNKILPQSKESTKCLKEG